jgi:lactam utilization protein B
MTLLNLDSKAKNWLTHVQKENPACGYHVEIPDQSNQPTTIDVEHVVSCGGKPAPRDLDATVSFRWDPQVGHWVISRFSS